MNDMYANLLLTEMKESNRLKTKELEQMEENNERIEQLEYSIQLLTTFCERQIEFNRALNDKI